VAQILRENNVRVQIDDGDDTIGKKIRNHRKLQPAYMIILGDGEEESRTVSLRARNGDQVAGISLEEFVVQIKEEISNKVSIPSLAVDKN
jgi:threonyl-tRNA synthetase